MFSEKVKVNTVFIRDSTGVSDSIVILFGSTLDCGDVVTFLCLDAYRFTFLMLLTAVGS